MRVFGRDYAIEDDNGLAGNAMRYYSKKRTKIMAKSLATGKPDAYLALRTFSAVAHLWCGMVNQCKHVDESFVHNAHPNLDATNSEILIDVYARGMQREFKLVDSQLEFEMGHRSTDFNGAGDRNEYYPYFKISMDIPRSLQSHVLAIGTHEGYQLIDEESFKIVADMLATYAETQCLENEHEGEIVNLQYCVHCLKPIELESSLSVPVCDECARRFEYRVCDISGKQLSPGEYHSNIRIVDFEGEEKHMTVWDGIINDGRMFTWKGHTNCKIIFCKRHRRREIVTYDGSRYVDGYGHVCNEGYDQAIADGTLSQCVVCGHVARSTTPSHITDVDGSPLMLCNDCVDNYYTLNNLSERRGLNAYGFKPLPVFILNDYKKSYIPEPDRLYLGIELELDNGYDKDDVSTELHENTGGVIYCKSDCSLDNGIELVTQPLGADYAVNEFEWYDVIETCEHRNFAEATTCGLHVHISRSFFGAKESPKREIAEARLIYLYDKFYRELRILGNREDDYSADRWAAKSDIRLDGEDDIDTVKNAKDRCRGRYRAINQLNTHTLEIRLFGATTNVEKLRNMLDLAQATAKIAKNIKLTDISEMETSDFVDALERYAVRPTCLRRYCEESGVA